MSQPRILSLGAGVQSTDLLLRSLRDEFDARPDYAVFADVGSEPKGVYRHLEWLIDYVDKEYGFEIHVIQAGNIYQDCLDFVNGKAKRCDGMPLFVRSSNGSKGMLNRQCTGYYKILPVRRFVKKDKPKGGQVELWLGISYEEMQRMKNPDVKWVRHRYPLVEKRIRRVHCLENFKAYGLPKPTRSSCTICPYHSDSYWYWLYQNESKEFEAAVALDDLIRIYPGIDDAECFLHRSYRPLKEVIVDIVKAQELGKLQTSLFPELVDECDGVCGS